MPSLQLKSQFNFKVIYISLISLIFFSVFLVFKNDIKAESATVVTSPQVCPLPKVRTGWSNSCTITKFNSALGNLLSVSVTMSIEVNTDAQIENQDNQPVPVTITRGANILLNRPDSTVFFTFIPTVQNTENFTAYDLVTDYDGTSGATYPVSTLSDNQSRSIVPADSDFSLFVGAGPSETLVFPVTANSILTFSSLTANFASIVNTFAQANISVVYTYQAPDPIPTSSSSSSSSVIRRSPNLIRTGGSDD